MKKIVIIGGAGFIGINTAIHFLKKGNEVVIFDNFSRFGSRNNAAFVKSKYPKQLAISEGDIRFDIPLLSKTVKNADVIFHLAGQVAVTTSILRPREDFEINAVGTMNVLETVRNSDCDPVLLYSSTNKVYGELSHVPIVEKKTRYVYKNLPYGVPENTTLDFYTPYGCSKGTGDQYFRDYHRIYGLNTIVFRQSCIYGPFQYGIEDQGWIAWFLISALKNRDITIFGDGKQVRDILYIDDLVNAYDMVIKNIKKTSGNIYNIGGGPENTLSIWLELQKYLEKVHGKKVPVKFAKARSADQRVYISDIRAAGKDFNWKPKISVEEGISRVYKWLSENISSIPD